MFGGQFDTCTGKMKLTVFNYLTVQTSFGRARKQMVYNAMSISGDDPRNTLPLVLVVPSQSKDTLMASGYKFKEVVHIFF